MRIDLAAWAALGGHAAGDTFASIEGIISSRHANTLTGGAGSDGLEGGAGADRLDGGTRRDTLWYATSDAGIYTSIWPPGLPAAVMPRATPSSVSTGFPAHTTPTRSSAARPPRANRTALRCRDA